MNAFVCVTCGTQFPPSDGPPPDCPICLDERQYVGHEGQRWTMAGLARDRRNRMEELEPGLLGIGTEPSFAIGQRGLLVEGLLWDCITLLDDETVDAVERAGGIHTIAISHPHYYSAMVEWAERSTLAYSCTRPIASGSCARRSGSSSGQASGGE